MSESAQDVSKDYQNSTVGTDTSVTGHWQVPAFTGSALLVSEDSATFGWAEKWLRRAGLEPTFAQSTQEAIGKCLEATPSIVIVEAGLDGPDGQPLYAMLNADLAFRNMPVMVLCHTSTEVEKALDAGVPDIVRKPIDWNLVGRRAASLAHHANMAKELERVREALRRSENEVVDSRRYLSRLGDTDKLTGLPTLNKFRELLARALYQSNELALFFVGLERFHLINDAHDRETGDRVLEKVGERLRASLIRPELHSQGGTSFLAACVAKLDGVRFGLFVPSNGGQDHLQTIRRVLTDVLSEPMEINGATVYLTSSIGGAVAPRDGTSAGELLQNAERAMMNVKQRGGGFALHSQDTGLSSARLLELDRWLREGVANNELEVHYQPLVNLWNNRIVGAEALLRWHRGKHGYISPAEFVPVAERSGIVVEIGDFVIESACAQLRRWLDAGHRNQRVAVNLSLIQLRRGDVKRTVSRAIDMYDIDPSQLELEISERGAIGDDQRIVRQLHELKALGIRLSLDDFGTGDTAIEYLKRLPIDVLKLDRSYVAGALENGVDSVIASALVGLAKNMNLTVIAEGVESREQFDLLRSWGCHLYQGYYCSPAVPGDDFLELLDNQSTDSAQEYGP